MCVGASDSGPTELTGEDGRLLGRRRHNASCRREINPRIPRLRDGSISGGFCQFSLPERVAAIVDDPVFRADVLAVAVVHRRAAEGAGSALRGFDSARVPSGVVVHTRVRRTRPTYPLLPSAASLADSPRRSIPSSSVRFSPVRPGPVRLGPTRSNPVPAVSDSATTPLHSARRRPPTRVARTATLDRRARRSRVTNESQTALENEQPRRGRRRKRTTGGGRPVKPRSVPRGECGDLDRAMLLQLRLPVVGAR